MDNSTGRSGIYLSVGQLLNHANARVAADDINGALRSVMQFVQAVIRDPRTIAKVFADRSLDAFCQGVGARVLSSLPPAAITSTNAVMTGAPVYLATELYATGGHTAVLEDLLKSGCFPGQSTILLTNTRESADLPTIERRFAPYGVNIECAPDGDLKSRLIWILRRLQSLQPSHLFLFNHHEDCVAVAAAQGGLAGQIIFHHHADHHLCLGVTLDYDLHIDPSPMGYHNCRDHLDVQGNIYWPLTVEDRGAPALHQRTLTAGGKLRTCSSGTRNKFEQPYQFDYGDLVPQILEVTQGTHVHIGLLSDSTLARIAEGMQGAGVSADKFIYVEWVQSLWQAMQDQAVDVYLGSFPVSGARAAVEVLGSGTPIIAHESYLSRFHGGADMLYSQAFSWRTPDELLAYLADLGPERVQEEAVLARQRYEQLHTLDAMRTAIEAGHNAPPPGPLRPYTGDPLQTFLDDLAIGDRAVAVLNNEISGLRAELQRSTQSIAEIYASRSWKLATVIRGLAGIIRPNRVSL
jgi:hypothetical protein